MIKGIDYIGVGVGGLIINNSNELLLILRKKSPEKNFWSIPGGAIEFGETAENAVIREVKEELNIDCKIKKFIGFTNHILIKDKIHWIALSFELIITNGYPTIVEQNSHAAIQWFSLNQLPSNLTMPTKETIYRIKHGNEKY